jgi:hypothetical protein
VRCGSPVRTERGQTSLLIIGLFVVVVMLLAVVVDASAGYLRREGLDSLADGAALAGADGVQGEQVYTGDLPDGGHAPIDPQLARGFVERYLDQVGARARYPGLTVEVTADASAVVVRLHAPLRLPITPPGWQKRPVVTGSAASYVVVAD